MTRVIIAHKGQEILVDDEDYEYINQFKWYVFKEGYCKRTKEGKTVSIHREIMGAEKGEIVDHINRNKLDNRRENLRFVTRAQNAYNRDRIKSNSSGYIGVKWEKRLGKWIASARENGKYIFHEPFDCKHQAAKYYNEKIVQFRGEYAVINRIEEPLIPLSTALKLREALMDVVSDWPNISQGTHDFCKKALKFFDAATEGDK